MKYHPRFLSNFRSIISHSFLVVFALLFLCPFVLAMPSSYLAPSYPPCKEDDDVHTPADFSHCGPYFSSDYDLKSRPPLAEDNPEFRKGLLPWGSPKTYFDRNSGENDPLPRSGNGGRSSERNGAAVGYGIPSTSRPEREGTTQGRNFPTGDGNKQGLIKQNLLSVRLRATFSSQDVVGAIAPEQFREYGVAATFRLPWEWYSSSGWGGGLRLMTGAGALYGAGQTALVVSFIPLLALGSRDGRFTLDMGAGGALLSRHHFGTQDFGGPFQFALTAGVGVPLYKRIGVGYRYQHYSDARIYGPNTTGADLHMLELTYRF